MKSSALICFIICIAIIAGITGNYGCANIIPPSGGARDSLPPLLVNATPDDSTLNFKSNRITLTFDEFVDLDDVQNNLLFMPTFENVPIIEAKLRTLTIRIRDTLEPNTTYIFNFGNAIRDVNESNIVKDFTYTFSTGPVLDTLQIRGKVLLAENGKPDSTLIVVLHNTQLDSAVFKQRPRYVARLDSAGNFTFRNLPRDTFAIYAIGDAGIARRYTSPSQTFAFADSPLIAGSTALVTLYAYKEVLDNKPPTATEPSATKEKRLQFNTNLNNEQQDLLSNLILTFEKPLRLFDSTKVHLTTDSSFAPVSSYRVFSDSSKTKVQLQTQWAEGTKYHLILDKDFAEDSLKRRLLRADTISFTTRFTTDYGSFNIRVRNLKGIQNPVLQFVQNDQVTFSGSIASGTLVQTLFQPGEYELRILSDTNNNGIWDPGRFFGVKKQPEMVRPIERRITVRASYENEFEVAL